MVPCTAVPNALRTGEPAMVHDAAGLSHVAVPLSLGNLHLGALIAGQVFGRYPELLPLQRMAREAGGAPQGLLEGGRPPGAGRGRPLGVFRGVAAAAARAGLWRPKVAHPARETA